jgi:hypothetical protein
MNNNKSYFFHTVQNRGTQIAGVGYANFNLDLRSILGYKYDQYDAFNISMEAFMMEGGSLQNSDNSNFAVHIRGFPWMNNYYDSLQQYSDSRVIEVCSANSAEDEERDVYSAYFQKNIHQIAFYKPSTPIIPQFTMFITTPSGQFWEKLTNTSLGYMCCFCITGLDAYKVKRVPRPLVYRSYNRGNPTLVLNSAYATSIDPIDSTVFKKRIFRFDNVNWRQVIGNELYDRYKKFALVTTRLTSNYESSTYGMGNFYYALYLNGSNLVWEQTNNSPFVPAQSATVQLHGGLPVYIGMLRTNQGLLRHMKDCYIENVFSKPTQDIGSITIHWSLQNAIGLNTGVNMDSNFPFPTLISQFEIIPLVD